MRTLLNSQKMQENVESEVGRTGGSNYKPPKYGQTNAPDLNFQQLSQLQINQVNSQSEKNK